MLEALPRPGRPIGPEGADRIRELLESELYKSRKTLPRGLNRHRDTVYRSLRGEVGLCKANFKWIPHSMTETHKRKSLRISLELLQFLEESWPQKLGSAIVGGERWFYVDIPQSSMSLASGVPQPTIARRNIGVRKVMIWICFSTSGSYDLVMLPLGETFNRDFFIHGVLERYDEHRSETRKAKRFGGTFCRFARPFRIWFNGNLTRWAFTDYPILLIVPISHHAILGLSDISR
jgi:hypothetical protein